MKSFADSLAALVANKLSIADLVKELNDRGPVQGPMHRAELSMLDQMLAMNKIDERLHRSLTNKLKDVQTKGSATVTVIKNMPGPKAAAPVGNNDATLMAPPAEKTTKQSAYVPGRDAPGHDDATNLNPAGAGSDADATALNTSGASAAGDATQLNPSGGSAAGGGDGFDLLIDSGDDGEKTQMADEAAATTAFKAHDKSGPTTTGSRSGGPSTSSWNRMAVQGGGAPDREVHAGDTLKERFKLEKEVGRGGMGIVFKAIDERKVEAQDKNPWVAVKVLNPEFRKHPQALVALQRESRKAQQLTHDNILRVYDFDKDGTVIYMTMEYCDAGALKDWIKKNPNGMPWEKAWPIIAGLARGLGRAHRDNIVHSDFKPGNVMMTADGTPKLFDMGIARAAKSGADSKGETTVFDAGELGALTPAYASLEMIQGQPPELIDDIYALGITAYEILTGKHPFGKKNAEQAMKEGLKPPIVPGLGRKQQKTLQASVAFPRSARIKSCDEFLEGMRKQTAKDFALPAMIGVVVLTLALVGVGFGVSALKTRRIDAMGEQFKSAQFADPLAAVAALKAMDPEEAESTQQKYSQAIQDYFFGVANQQWNAEAKPPKYDFAGASSTLAIVSQMFPDSARVVAETNKLTDQKNDILKKLRTEYDQRYAAGLIYEDKPGNVVETLQLIAQIDKDYDLLKSQTLPIEYKKQINASIAAKDYERVAMQMASALKAFPNDASLKSLAADTKAVREAEIAKAKEREMQARMNAAQAKDELIKLAADPNFSADWQLSVNVAMSKVGADTSPELAEAKAKLAEAYAQKIGQMTADKQLASAQLLADAGMKNFPGVPGLAAEVAKLTTARKAYEAEQAKAAALAKVDDLKSTVLTQAKANDIADAKKALEQLRALAPNDPFLTNEAPKALADAYLKGAERLAGQKRFGDARKYISEGLKLAPSNQGLKDADAKYAVEGSAAMLLAGAQSPGSVRGEDMKAALDSLRAADAARAAKVLPEVEGAVVARIQSLAKSDPATASKSKAEWLKVFPSNAQLAAITISEAVAPSTPTQTASAAGSTAQPSLPAEAKKARPAVPKGVETCTSDKSTYGARSKAQCQDDVAGVPGPKMVVIPNPSGGFLAVSKYEITNSEFDQFCNATGKCRPSGASGALPRTNISLSQAKAYAAWLTETTGFTYRLPSDAEWTYAANAGAGAVLDDVNCVLMQGGNQIKGGLPVPANSGKANAWGIVNAVGNVAELTDGGGSRGGTFNVPMSQCTVDWRGSGSDSDSVGLRLVRETAG